MSATYLLGMDVGGGGGRCLLVDVESGACVGAWRSFAHPAVEGAAGLGYDLDLPALWRKLGEASREVLAGAGVSPSQVAGVAASAMRFASVVLDVEQRVIQAAPNRDARGTGEAISLAHQHGEALAARTGHWPAPVMPAARLLHLQKHDPAGFARAAHLLSLNDWLTFRLCGTIATEPSQAGCTLLFDVAKREWAWDWADRLGLDRGLLPEVRNAGDRAGELGADAAEALGLAPGTPVAMAGGDTQCGLLGAGVTKAGMLGAVAGTTMPVQLVCDRPAADPEFRLWIGHHVVPGLWAAESNAGPSGEAAAWAGRFLAPDAPDPAARLFAEASQAPAGAFGCRSTFGGQVGDARALALPVGDLTLCHLAVDADTGRAAVARAIVEGMAFSLRGNVEQLMAIASPGLAEPPPLHLTGGMSRSGLFSRLVADVLGVPVHVGRQPEATGLGAAICAGVGAGIFESLEAGADVLAASREKREPEARAVATYADLYDDWCALRTARAPGVERAVAAALPSVLAATPAGPTPAAGPARPRILVTASVDDEALESLRALGEVEYAPFRERMRLLTGEALVEALAEVQVFITEVDVVDARSMASLPELRVVASCRGDAVNVDVEAATALGIPVLNAPGRNADAVADLTVAYLLMLARRLAPANAFLRDPSIREGDIGKMGQAFQAFRGRELWGKTVGLVGLGAVGRGVARRLAGFGARVIVADPFLPPEVAVRAGAEPVDLDELLAVADFVSLHAPVTPETEGLIGAAELARMKPGACLVNSARAALVDEAALIDAVASGRLAGVATDVFPTEPPGHDHPLLAFENVVATPHIGGNTEEVAAHQGRIIADDLARLLSGQRPRHALDPEATEGFTLDRERPELSEARLDELASRPGPAVTDLQKKDRKKRAAVEPPAGSPAPSAAPAEGPAETTEAMARIVRGFVEGIVGDARLAAFSAGKDVTLHFMLTDLPIEFHFRLRSGVVSGEPTPPAERPEVELRMRADVLDGMFTGRVNPMQSALRGGLSFSGDTAKAMTLQQIQGDLSRLYVRAREAAGDPGDLAGLPDPSGAAGAPASISEPGDGDVRHELVAAVEELYRAELITATGGNVSVRVPGHDDEIWITPSQLFKGDLRPELLVRIGLDGGRLEGSLSPSSEWMMHCALYRAKPDARAVVHAHAPHATILANAELPFLPVSTEAAFFGNIPRVPFIMPGTRELADAIAEAVGDGWAVLMKNHGLLMGGRTLRRAADMVEIVDRSAQVMLGCWALGKEPPSLPAEVVETLRALGDLVA